MDLSVKEEGVSTKDDGGDGEKDGESSGWSISVTSGADLLVNRRGGRLETGKNGVDVGAARGIGVEVLAVGGQVGFASSGLFVRLLAQFNGLVVVVSVVVSIVVIVVVVVNLLAGDAFGLDHGFAVERKLGSVVASSVDIGTVAGSGRASSIMEKTKMDGLSVLGTAVCTNEVLLVVVGGVSVVVVVVVSVVSAVVVSSLKF